MPKLIKHGTDTIDVGVYRGIYSYELSRLSNHIHAFEANPIIYEYLQNNLTHIIKNITLYNYALSDRKGIASLRVPIRRKTIFKSQFEEKYYAGHGTIHESNTFNEIDKFDEQDIIISLNQDCVIPKTHLGLFKAGSVLNVKILKVQL